jgi:hypothetical protein
MKSGQLKKLNTMNPTIKQQAQALIKLEEARLEKINNKRKELFAAYEDVVKRDVIAKLNTANLADVQIFPSEGRQYHTVRVASSAGVNEYRKYKRCYKPNGVSSYSVIETLRLLLRHKIITKKQLSKLA